MNVEETAGATRRLGLMSTVECRFVLRIEGVFSYAPGLAARIDPGELLEPGSPEEVEIRACAISAVERMVEHATRRWRGMAAARGLTESNPSSERGPRARRRPTSSVLAVRRGHGGDLFPSERRAARRRRRARRRALARTPGPYREVDYLAVMVALEAVCVFCGSSTPPDGSYSGAARALGGLLAARSKKLVYGGGRAGLMGELADACLAQGGRVTGVIPVGLLSREVGHPGLTQLHEVRSMHERKQLMYDLADAFVALPGGLGTLEELAEVATWSQLGLHHKPLVLLDVNGFWDPLVDLLNRMVTTGLLKAANRELIQTARSPGEALQLLATAEPVHVEQWITIDER